MLVVAYTGIGAFYRVRRRYHRINTIPGCRDINDRQTAIPWVLYLPAAAALTTPAGRRLRVLVIDGGRAAREVVLGYVSADETPDAFGTVPPDRNRNVYPDTVSRRIRVVASALIVIAVVVTVPLTTATVVALSLVGVTGTTGALVAGVTVWVLHVAIGVIYELPPAEGSRMRTGV